MLNRDVVFAASALLLALVLRIVALSGEMGPDSTVYAQHAWNLLHGDFDLCTDSWYAHRLPVFFPVSALYALAGVGRTSTAAWPILVSLAQVAAAFWLGRRLFGPAAGWIAALVLAAFPLDAIEAGRLMPDVILGGLMGIAGALWIGARSSRAALATGILLGLATVVRPYALILAPLIALDALVSGGRRRDAALVLAGLAAVAIPVLAAYGAGCGDLLFRWRVVSGAYGSGVMAEAARLDYYPRLLFAPWQATGLHALLLTGCFAIALVDPGRSRTRLLVWLAACFAFLQFGSMSLGEWVPILKRVRFLTILSLPGAVLIGSVVAGIAGWTAESRRWIPPWSGVRRLLRTATVVGLTGLAALCIWRIDLDRSTRAPRNAAFEAVGDLVRAHPALPVHADHWRTAIRVAYYARFEAGSHYYFGAEDRERMDPAQLPADTRIGYLRWYDDAGAVPDGLLVLDEEALADLRKLAPTGRTYSSNDIPEWVLDPPADWALEFEGAGLRVYRVGPG